MSALPYLLYATALLCSAPTSAVVVFDNKPCRTPCIRTAMFRGYDEDHALLNHVIARFQVQSSLNCLQLCIEDHRCESFNCEYVNKPSIHCELSNATKLTVSALYAKRPGYQYHDAMGAGVGAGDGWCNSICSTPYKSSVCSPGFAGLDCRTTMKSCKDWQNHGFIQDGVYFLSAANLDPFPVYCDQTTDGGGWTMLQRRQDGSVDFYRNWEEYKAGFGNLSGEFWLGNDVIHVLTTVVGLNELRVDLENFEDVNIYAKYRNFTILNEKNNYTLLVSGFSGTAGDSLGNIGSPPVNTVSNSMPFSTLDRDNDNWVGGSCAVEKHGAWWFNACYWSHLNGPYKEKGKDGGINWYAWYRSEVNYKTLKRSEMKIRPLV